jgi:hypothetical protein
MEEAGIVARYDWHGAHIGTDDRGDFVVLEIEWHGEPIFNVARQYIDQQFVTVEWPD